MRHLISRIIASSAVVLVLLAGAAAAQPAYSGPPGAVHMQKAQKLQAAGDKAGAAAAYQQAYEAYTSVDDSDGMVAALAGKKALGEKAPAAKASAAPGAAAAPRPMPAGAAVAPIAGKVVGGKPVGLFFMTRYIIAFHSLEKATYYFTPGGSVFVNPVDFNPASLAALSPHNRGSYSVAGGSLNVKWADGQTSKSTLEDPSGNAFNWDMGIFVGMGPFANARQLVGAFEGGNSVSSSSGSAAAVSSLTFRADGTYSGGSASSFSTNTSDSNSRIGSSGETAGRWALSGWTLTLTDAAGRTSRGVAYPIEKDDKTGQVRRFYFNSVAYKRL
ncbi:hypothetical protein [Hymenobacter daeguensis]